jgi:hypothetical protein
LKNCEQVPVVFLSPLPLCCSAVPPAASRRRSPRLLAAPRRSTRTTWPSSSPARRLPYPRWLFPAPPRRAVIARSCHACRRPPAATLACPCLFLVPQHVQEPSSTSFILSRARIFAPRLLLRSAPPPNLHRSPFSPSSRRFAPSWPSPSSPPALHLHVGASWPLSRCLLALCHRNAAAASGPHRAGSVLRRTAISTPSFFDSCHLRARHELLNLFPHFPLAAGEPPRRNLIAVVLCLGSNRPGTQLHAFFSF